MKINTLCFLLIFLCTGCSGYKKAEGGLYYKIVKDCVGHRVQINDFVAFHLKEENSDDKKMINEFLDVRMTMLFRERSPVKGDLSYALGLLSEGDSAVFKATNISGASRFRVYTIKIDKVIRRSELNDSLFNIKIQELKDAEYLKARLAEPEKIARYITALKTKPKSTSTGLSYFIQKMGKGRIAKIGDTLLFNYTAKLLNGKPFETTDIDIAKLAGIFNPSISYGPVKLLMIKKDDVPGIDQAILSFPRGTSGTLILPSKLAFGGSPYKDLQPYTPIVCDFNIVDSDR